MSNQMTWEEMLDIDPARAFRLREEEISQVEEIGSLRHLLENVEFDVSELQTEVRNLTQRLHKSETRERRLRRKLFRLKKQLGQKAS